MSPFPCSKAESLTEGSSSTMKLLVEQSEARTQDTNPPTPRTTKTTTGVKVPFKLDTSHVPPRNQGPGPRLRDLLDGPDPSVTTADTGLRGSRLPGDPGLNTPRNPLNKVGPLHSPFRGVGSPPRGTTCRPVTRGGTEQALVAKGDHNGKF